MGNGRRGNQCRSWNITITVQLAARLFCRFADFDGLLPLDWLGLQWTASRLAAFGRGRADADLLDCSHRCRLRRIRRWLASRQLHCVATRTDIDSLGKFPLAATGENPFIANAVVAAGLGSGLFIGFATISEPAGESVHRDSGRLLCGWFSDQLL